jgi:hypothetical protein
MRAATGSGNLPLSPALPVTTDQIVIARPSHKRPGRSWYALVVVSGTHPPGTILWSASAHRRVNPNGGPMQANPDEHEAALATLTHWAHGNRWTLEA